MAVKFRLQRHGAKKKPFYFIVVSDSRSPRDGKILEKVGTYNPNLDPSEVVLKQDRAKFWYDRGARPTDTVKKLLKIANFSN